MKKKHFAIFVVLLCVSIPTIAQDTTYYDEHWEVTDAPGAACYRLKTKKEDLWQVKDCYKAGNIQMEGYYRDESCKISQGRFAYFDDKGHLYHISYNDDGQLDGADTLFYDNNQIRTTGNYKDDERSGEWFGYYPSGKLSARAMYKKGNQKSGEFYNEDGSKNESVHEFSSESEYPGGPSALQRFLTRNLHYPENEVHRSMQGTVIVGFIVTKEGKINKIKIVRSVDDSIDQEAIRVIGLMPFWEPLIIGGILCDSYRTQPIVFTLE